jgi:hypothetical protein
MLYVYGFVLSDRIWLASLVMVLVVACSLGCVFLTILTGPPYIPFCLYHLARRHMMCSHFKSFIGFPVYHSSSVTLFPLALAFFLFSCNKIIMSISPSNATRLMYSSVSDDTYEYPHPLRLRPSPSHMHAGASVHATQLAPSLHK